MAGDEYLPLLHYKWRESMYIQITRSQKIIVFDGSKQGDFFGVFSCFKLALNLDRYHFLKALKGTDVFKRKLGTGRT